MANKKSYNDLCTDVESLKIQVLELNKQLAAANSSKDYYIKLYNTERSENENVHAVLDVLPNTIGRKKVDGYSDHTLMTRLAAFFAVNKL